MKYLAFNYLDGEWERDLLMGRWSLRLGNKQAMIWRDCKPYVGWVNRDKWCHYSVNRRRLTGSMLRRVAVAFSLMFGLVRPEAA